MEKVFLKESCKNLASCLVSLPNFDGVYGWRTKQNLNAKH